MVDKLVHIHIPRTGGTTLKKVLDSVYGDDGVHYLSPSDNVREASPLGIYIRDPGSLWYLKREEFDRDWGITRKNMRSWESQFGIWHGHTPLYLYDWCPWLEDAMFVTILRHPVSLVVSWYLWEVRQQLYDGDIEDFIEQEQYRNIQTRMLALNGTSPHRNVLLLHYEFLREDIALLGQRMGWPNFLFPWTNRVPTLQYMKLLGDILANKKLVGRMYRLNYDDVQYFEYSIVNRLRRHTWTSAL